MAHKTKSGQSARPLFAPREKLPRRDALRLLALMAATFVCMMAVMIIAVTPERLSLSAGDIAPRTITATKDVVDEINTTTHIREAERNAQVSYTDDDAAETRSLSAISAAFDRMEAVRADASQALDMAASALAPGTSLSDEQVNDTLSDKELTNSAREALDPVVLSDAQLRVLQHIDSARLKELKTATERALRICLLYTSSWRRDLNLQPADYKSAALPIELRQHAASFLAV